MAVHAVFLLDRRQKLGLPVALRLPAFNADRRHCLGQVF
jgi:hypothetical protein